MQIRGKLIGTLAILAAAAQALAGGPGLVRSNGSPVVWSTATEVQYRTDDGPLSATVDEAAAQLRVVAMFNVWESVPTASIGYNRAGFIADVGAAFTDGDVSTAVEYAAVQDDCFNGNQSPVVYDVDATILVDLGFDESSVIGFAGPCSGNATNFLTGQVVMNGLFQDGQAAPVQDIPAAAFNAAIIHEVGHFSGLDHSQVNVNCMNPCTADDLAGLPTMFPFLVSSTQGSLSADDIAWISRLYPAPSFATTHGTISGTVFFSDGESHAQFVNVIARPLDTGANQDRTSAVSVISGYKFRAIHGNPLTGDTADPFGTTNPADIGLFEIPVPIGSYMIEVESIDAQFVDGSGIGAYQIAMPGTAPAPVGPVVVSPNAVSSGNNVTLIGTPPRFDQFEGP